MLLYNIMIAVPIVLCPPANQQYKQMRRYIIDKDKNGLLPTFTYIIPDTYGNAPPLSVADLQIFNLHNYKHFLRYIPGPTHHNRPDSEMDIILLYLIPSEFKKLQYCGKYPLCMQCSNIVYNSYLCLLNPQPATVRSLGLLCECILCHMFIFMYRILAT